MCQSLHWSLVSGRGKEPLSKHQQVVRSWKVVQPPDFRETVVLECSGKCEKQVKQDGIYVLADFPDQIMIARLHGRQL